MLWPWGPWSVCRPVSAIVMKPANSSLMVAAYTSSSACRQETRGAGRVNGIASVMRFFVSLRRSPPALAGRILSSMCALGWARAGLPVRVREQSVLVSRLGVSDLGPGGHGSGGADGDRQDLECPREAG
ncbi:hypothetical protein ACFPRL_04395 [Pseudoclavibacter helvolus]